MTRIVLPRANWHMALADAVRDAEEDTVIVVNTEAQRELGEIAAGRMGKRVSFEVEP